MAGSSCETTIGGSSGQITLITKPSAPSPQYITLSPTQNDDVEVTVPTTAETSELNPDDYSEPEYTLPRDESPADTDLYTYAEGFTGQRSQAAVDASGFKCKGNTSSEGCDEEGYSVLQNPTRGASGNADYDRLNYQRSSDVVIVRSDDHEYGQLSRD